MKIHPIVLINYFFALKLLSMKFDDKVLVIIVEIQDDFVGPENSL